MNFEKEIADQIKKSVSESVRKHMDDYGSPLKQMVFDAIKVHDAKLRSFIYEAVSEVFLDDEFRAQSKTQIKHKIARELATTFGEGIFKKSIEQMKGDPTLRARCVLAIENILNEASK